MPQIGEIRHGNDPDIGFKGKALVIYIKCSDCDKTYWTPYDKTNNKPRTKTCRDCANLKQRNSFMSVKYFISDKSYGIRPYWKGYL